MGSRLRSSSCLAFALVAALVLALAGLRAGEPAPAARSTAEAEEIFRKQVEPVLRSKCLGCHGEGDQLEGGLDLRSRAALLRGGENGPAAVPGHAPRSLLYQAVLRTGALRMPPQARNQLTPAEREAFRTWIDAGLPWPAAPTARQTTWESKPEDVWAFQPLRSVAIPPVARDPWVRTPLDAFILQKLAEQGLRPAPPADRVTLLRRVTFDLTGLPPTPEEIDAFVQDTAADAWERVLDRLLASPRYGEHWARHWLDVVRYADTSGFSNDYERPNAWRYRDYVIRSFNEDRPYDRFILEQLAGDELDPKDPDLQIAVGYLRMGPWEHTGMSVAAVTRQMFLDDVTNAVGTTFLALPLSCARCHDHKFDPIPTHDYYRIQAVFAPVQFAEKPTPFLPGENTAGFEEAAARVRERMQVNQARLREIQEKPKQALAELLRKNNLQSVNDLPPEVRRDKRLGISVADGERERVYRKRLEYYQRELQRYQPQAFSVTTAAPADVFVLVGGALGSPGEKVSPGALSVVRDHPTFPATGDGRRLALARWIASPQNPLTARVLVNRVWQYHFGKGLVETSNNFGKMGKRPTHPELLDWLTRQFLAQGWSIKALHRLILRSAVYQQAAEHPDRRRLAAVDPQNRLLACFPPRRLTAEELRDSILAVAGALSQTAGGPPVFPEINRDVALQPRQIMGTIAPIYEPSPTREQRNRRTIYTVQLRNLPNPLLEVFNAASMDNSCERRDETTVTPQVFALFNSQALHDAALAWAQRLRRELPDREARVTRLFCQAYGRPPSATERVLVLGHLERMLAHHRQVQPVPEKLPRQLVRTHIAELSGAQFDFIEDWDLLRYEPNLKPWDVDPETRALAELCLVVLNSNEFVFVY